jgi:hypothetical protein
MLKVQKYILENGLQALMENYKISVKVHKEYPNLISLKYSQIESPMDRALVQECRGLILDKNNNYAPVAFPYTKFFNHGEGFCAQVNYYDKTTRIYEKVDGSLCILYHYDNHWEVATSGLPDASGSAYGEKTYRDLFWEVYHQLGYVAPKSEKFCYMFELCHPKTQIVCRHKEPKLVLHGARQMISHDEVFPDNIAKENSWECVRSFPFNSNGLDEALAMTKNLNGFEQEGVVVCDKNFNRVKIKAPHYVRMHHMKSDMNPMNMINLVIRNEGDEALTYFPELKPEYDKYREIYHKLLIEWDIFYSRIQDISDRKAFALEATKHNCSFVMFNRRFKGMSFEKSFLQMTDKRLKEIFLIT